MTSIPLSRIMAQTLALMVQDSDGNQESRGNNSVLPAFTRSLHIIYLYWLLRRHSLVKAWDSRQTVTTFFIIFFVLRRHATHFSKTFFDQPMELRIESTNKNSTRLHRVDLPIYMPFPSMGVFHLLMSDEHASVLSVSGSQWYFRCLDDWHLCFGRVRPSSFL